MTEVTIAEESAEAFLFEDKPQRFARGRREQIRIDSQHTVHVHVQQVSDYTYSRSVTVHVQQVSDCTRTLGQ